jgi:hypothetical protein
MSTHNFKTHTMRVPSLLTRLFMRHIIIIDGHSTELDWNVPHVMTFIPSFAKICQLLKNLKLGTSRKHYLLLLLRSLVLYSLHF